MGWLWWFLLLPLGVVAAWAILAPRNQWRVLFAWSVSDRHTSEPGGAAYAFRRIIAVLALGGAALVAVLAIVSSQAQQTQAPTFPSSVEDTWGSPAPLLVYRAFQPSRTPTDDLVDVAIASYLPVNDDEKAPLYLLDLEPFSRLGTTEIPGYLGSEPTEDDSIIGRADVVVHVKGPLLCIPRRVVAIETPERVQLAVLYGMPTPSGGSTPDNSVECADGGDVTGSVLIPISLDDPIGERSVESLDGTLLNVVGSQD